jgi:hypothetical protein
MKTNKFLGCLAAWVRMTAGHCVRWSAKQQWDTAMSLYRRQPRLVLGADASPHRPSISRCGVRHNDANQPIEWYTNTIRRMTLSPTLLGQNVNVYTGLDLSGHLGIGNFTNLPGGPPPLTMIHLDNLGNQVAGYRPWMHTGVGMSDASEWMVVVRTAGKSPEV